MGQGAAACVSVVLRVTLQHLNSTCLFKNNNNNKISHARGDRKLNRAGAPGGQVCACARQGDPSIGVSSMVGGDNRVSRRGLAAVYVVGASARSVQSVCDASRGGSARGRRLLGERCGGGGWGGGVPPDLFSGRENGADREDLRRPTLHPTPSLPTHTTTLSPLREASRDGGKLDVVSMTAACA